MKKLLIYLLTLAFIITAFASCNQTPPETSKSPESTPEKPTETDPIIDFAHINGVDISEYAIVYSNDAPDYNRRAAKYVKDEIKARTDADLTIKSDTATESKYEILIGETDRQLSKDLDADTEGFEFAITASETKIALEGDYFIIAAAAYFFVETYVTGECFDSKVPMEETIHTPIVETPDNFIFLIGDGMGVYQTKIFDYIDTPTGITTDKEDFFYGYLFPYQGMAKTNSLSGTTDSAAGGTALASGYKTINKYIGKDKNRNDVQSLTELADSLGKATAVMSTEAITGATPASFSAHANLRTDTNAIKASQALLTNTLLRTTNNSYSDAMATDTINKVLDKLSQNENGFFIMYEEAYIDKHCHNNDFENTFKTVLRFNQAIGTFMEFAFYNPNTFVLITADHETGALYPDDGTLKYHSGNHSSSDVPVFAYGVGAEIFNNKTIENVQIPKTIAKFWGKDDFGDTSSAFPPLNERIINMKNILFVGNSYTYYNDMPAILTALAKSAGIEVNTKSIVKGGATLQWHLTANENGDVVPFNELRSSSYDFVVIQEQSDRPAIDPKAFLDSVKLLCDEAKKCGATPVFYSTWAKKEGHENLKKYSMTRPEMADRLASSYRLAAEESEGLLAPVGKAFMALSESHPEIELYNPDGSHPSYAGSYLAAIILFAAIFEEAPEKCTFAGELDEKIADILKKAARDAVLSER